MRAFSGQVSVRAGLSASVVFLGLVCTYAPAYGDFVVPVGQDFLIASNAGDASAVGGKPAIASDGTNFFVVWSDDRDSATSGNDVYGARIAPDGTVLDPTGILISDLSFSFGDTRPSVAFDGTNYMVVWNGGEITGQDILAARVTPDGTVLDPGGVQLTTGVFFKRMPSIAFDGTNYLVVCRTDSDEIRGLRLTTAGVNLDGPGGFVIGTGFYPYVAFDGANYLVVWYYWGNALDVVGARVSPGGAVLAPGTFNISAEAENQSQPTVAFDGTNYLVVWGDQRGGDLYNKTTYGARVSAAGVVLDDPSFKIAEYSRSPGGDDTGNGGVAFDGTDFFVVWSSDTSPFKHRLWDTFGRRVSTSGVRVDEKAIPVGTRLNHQLIGLTGAVAFGMDRYLVVWNENDNFIVGQLLEKSATIQAPSLEVPAEETDWVQEPNVPSVQSLNAIWGSGENDIFVVGDFGTVLYFDGIVWSSQDSGTLEHLFGVWGSGVANVYAVGDNGTILHYDGSTWLGEISGTSEALLDVWSFGSSVWAVGDNGLVLKKSGTWSAETGVTSLALNNIFGFDASNVYVAAGSGSPVDVLRYDGSSWSVWSQLNAARLFGLWGTGTDDIWSVGWCQDMWHFDGATWTQTGCQGALIGTGIWGSSSTDVWMVGSMNALYSEPFSPAELDVGAIFLHYDGINWNPVVSGFNVDFWDIWGTPSGRLYAVGEYGAIIRFGGGSQALILNPSVWWMIALVAALAFVACLGVRRMML